MLEAAIATLDPANDPAVKRPQHYTSHPSGVEIYLITQEMWCPNLANTFKYMARHTLKGNPAQDIRKAMEYVGFEIARRKQAWFALPVIHQLTYETRYAPFYLYIDGEPDEYLSRQLVRLWNADKGDGYKALNDLVELETWLGALATEIERREAEEREAREIAAIQKREDLIFSAEGFFAVMEAGGECSITVSDLYEFLKAENQTKYMWNSFQMYTRSAIYRPISHLEEKYDGGVWIWVFSDTGTYKLKRKWDDEITVKLTGANSK